MKKEWYRLKETMKVNYNFFTNQGVTEDFIQMTINKTSAEIYAFVLSLMNRMEENKEEENKIELEGG